MSTLQYLFDTNILSSLIKQPAGVVAQKIANLDGSSFCTSIIVACELRYGASKKGSVSLLAKIESLLENIVIVPMEANVDRCYADLRVNLESRGQPISAHDMLIAAHALALDLTLVTANEREFMRISNLRVENWLQL